MDQTQFIDECFSDWDEDMMPSDGAITKAIRHAKTDVGIALAEVVAGSDQQTLYENRVQHRILWTLLRQSAQEYSSGAVGNRSDIFAHYRAMLEMLEKEWEHLKHLVAPRKGGGFQAIPAAHRAPGGGVDLFGRPLR